MKKKVRLKKKGLKGSAGKPVPITLFSLTLVTLFHFVALSRSILLRSIAGRTLQLTICKQDSPSIELLGSGKIGSNQPGFELKSGYCIQMYMRATKARAIF